MVPETSGICNQMKGLITKEDCTSFSCRESFKSYVRLFDEGILTVTSNAFSALVRLLLYTVENSEKAGATSRRKSENCFVVAS